MICRLTIQFLLLAFGVMLTQSAPAQSMTLRLADGSLLSGVPVSFDADGLVVRLPAGGYSPRVGWTNFNEEALLALAELPKAAEYVQPLLAPPEEEEEEIALEIKPKPVDRLSRLDPNAGLDALFASPVSLALFALMFLGSIYAGWEIAVFRNFPPAAGAAAGALLPFLGPLIMICLPTHVHVVHEPAALTAEQIAAQQQADLPVAEVVEEPEEEAQKDVKPARTAPISYKRGTTSFNRRFFETKFAGFLRVVPGEAEKDMEMFFSSSRGDYVSSRLTKVTPTEVQIQIAKGDATADILLPFTEIMEVQVRPKETASS